MYLIITFYEYFILKITFNLAVIEDKDHTGLLL